MAGKRQHFVPQLLQRGFASHYSGNEAYTWVYRRGTQPFNTNIKNVGVEGLFYSVDQDTELDRAITSFEGEYNSLLADLRSIAVPAIVDAPRIATLLAHLEIRTRHVRQSVLKTGTHLWDALMRFASDEEAFGRYFRRAIERDPSLMQEAMAKQMQTYGIPMQLLPQVMEASKPLLEQFLPSTLSQMSVFATQFRSSLPEVLNKAAKSGHVKALVEALAPAIKVDRLSSLQFEVVECGEVCLPLGDFMVLFQVSGERNFKPFFEGKDELVAIFLPLSRHRVLIGSEVYYELDGSLLRREIARCSLEHFISSEGPLECADLMPIIGENAHLLSIDQAEAMVNELING